MQKICVFSTDSQLNSRVEQICQRFQSFFEPHFFDQGSEGLEFLKYELPELNVVHMSDGNLDVEGILEEIRKDPWLHYGGLVLVYARRDREVVFKSMPQTNVLTALSRSEFVEGFFRTLRILVQNRQIVFQRDLQTFLMRNISGSLIMENDPFDVGLYANLLSNYLYNSNYLSREGRDQLHVALFEMLMNAVEHGNCAISYSEKTKWLADHGDILHLIREKNRNPEVRAKRVHFSYRISADKSEFTIRDEGSGFNWRARIGEDQGSNMGMHGRGIAMTGIYASNVRYNDVGNEVSFEFAHQKNASNELPSILVDQRETVFEDGETVFHEGEESNFLYYIVSGALDVFSGGQFVSRLTPGDMFLGEMSFLLSNRRSATVKSHGRSELIKISKNAFVGIMKSQPHYGIFLARLLAMRLQRVNKLVERLKLEKDSFGALVAN